MHDRLVLPDLYARRRHIVGERRSADRCLVVSAAARGRRALYGNHQQPHIFLRGVLHLVLQQVCQVRERVRACILVLSVGQERCLPVLDLFFLEETLYGILRQNQ